MVAHLNRFVQSKWLIIALMLLAFALRVYHLESQSLWSDEGLSLYRSRLTLSENLTNVIVVPPNVSTQDTNPPLYFILLSGVRALAGETEYALRFLSVLAGVLLVPLLYVTGRRLFSRSTGVFAAMLGTLSPFMVWYSQEARMYALVAMFSLASIYLLLRAIEFAPNLDQPLPARNPRRWPIWIAWGALTLAALATHFIAFFVLPFAGGVLLLALGRSRRREAVIVAIGLIVLAAPLVVYGVTRAQRMLDPVFHFRPLDSVAQETLSSFLVGSTKDIFQPLWAVAPGLLLLAVGAIGGLLIRARRVSTLFTLLFLLVPLLIFYAGTFFMPLYIGPRHIIFTLPPIYLLLAYGLALIWQRLRLAGIVAATIIFGLMAWWLVVQFTDPAYLKDDIRSAACTIAMRAKTADVVVMSDAISSYMFDYYYTRCGGIAPWKIIPVYPSLAFEPALRQFQAAAEAADRIWYLVDPSRGGGFDSAALDQWARGHLLRLDHQRFPSMWLGSQYQLYTAHFPIYDVLPIDVTPRNLEWLTGTLHLAGVGPIVVSPDRAVVTTTLYWQLDQQPSDNFIFTQRLVDDTGAEWGLEIGTAFDNWSAKQWPIGKLIKQVAQIDLPHGLPAGHYRLVVSVADKAGQPFTLPDGSIESEAAEITMSP